MRSSSDLRSSSSCGPWNCHFEKSLFFQSFSFLSKSTFSFLMNYALTPSLTASNSRKESCSVIWYFKCPPKYTLTKSPKLTMWFPVPVIILLSQANSSCCRSHLIIRFRSPSYSKNLLKLYMVWARSAALSFNSLVVSTISWYRI